MATRRHKSEAWALRGSNQKVQWVQSWATAAPDDRGETALRSPFLVDAFESYEKAFGQDLNSFYPGLVALSLLTIRTELITRYPAIWAEEFATEAEETVARATLDRDLAALAGAVRLALQADPQSEWYAMSWADYQFLVSEKPTIVLAAYRRALKGQQLFHSAAARRQLQIFADLGLKPDRIADCLAMFAHTVSSRAAAAHVVVFTGHMIDEQGRSAPRFPESCVDAARSEIRARLVSLKPDLGIAAAASGGDIIFHEVCADLNIPTDIRLVMPPQHFVNESVVKAGPQWAEKYWSLVKTKQAEGRFAQLGEARDLPGWLKRKPEYTIWNRANLWMLEYALSKAPERLTVMALWDGKKGDGPGGTRDLLATGEQLGATPSVIRTDALCGALSGDAAEQGRT
jgi:hypothetical protein